MSKRLPSESHYVSRSLRPGIMRWTLLVTLLLWPPAAARAELTPEEVGLIAMASGEQSRRLAEYYAEKRGVPDSQIFLLEGKPDRVMPHEVWHTQARPAIRAWLNRDGLQQVRCLVTCWDVPLRIGKRSADDAAVVGRKKFFSQARGKLVEGVVRQIESLDGLAPDDRRPQRPAIDADVEAGTLRDQFEAALKAAGTRLQAIESEEEKVEAAKQFERAFVAGGGLTGLLRLAARRPEATESNPELVRRTERYRGQLQGLGEGLQAMGRLPDSVAADVQMLGIVRKTNGLIGAIQWIDQQQELLRKNETGSSFDSELSLLLWPDYRLFRWQPNLLRYTFGTAPFEQTRTLMVSRLAAPTFELATKLIDTAIATEKAGLSGKVYLDARGIKFRPEADKRGSYGEYDQSLRDLAERLNAHTELEVVLNDEAALFQDGECPDAALYCGWYSLAKYVDAFQWRPGAVGYHMASSEASRLRKPGAKVWCNAMLEDGICATLGPAFEPYLYSFPLPDHFFSLLLTGQYTLAEAYYRTKPFNSWAMVLVGDPLYNPFKNDPPLREEELPEGLRTSPPEAATP